MKEYPTLQSVKEQFLRVTKIINLQLAGKKLNRRVLQRILRTAKTNPNHVFASLYLFAGLQCAHHKSQRNQIYDALVYRVTGISRDKEFFLVQFLLGAGDQVMVAVSRMILYAWSEKGEDFRRFGLGPNWWVSNNNPKELALAGLQLVRKRGLGQYFVAVQGERPLREHNHFKKEKQKRKKEKTRKRKFLSSAA